MHSNLIFVAKYRRAVFDQDAIERLRVIFTKVSKKAEAERVEIDGEEDHIHLLITYHPKVSISTIVNSLKGVSSRLLRKQRPDIAARYYKGMLCLPSYFAGSCGGALIAVMRQYIENQKSPL